MTRCPACDRPCSEQDYFCRHCGARLRKIPQKFWRMADWIDGQHALRALAASVLLLAARIMVHPLLMIYEGERHEGRVAAFHLLLGLAFGLVLAPLRGDGKRWRFWLAAGILGGLLDWAFDYAYMADHIVSQAVFYVLDWMDPSADSNSIAIGFGILQTLRFTGMVLILGLAAAWKARRGVQLRIMLFSLLALAFRSPVLGYALSYDLFRLYWHQPALYFTSLFALFYGLGPLDVNSAK